MRQCLVCSGRFRPRPKRYRMGWLCNGCRWFQFLCDWAERLAP